MVERWVGTQHECRFRPGYSTAQLPGGAAADGSVLGPLPPMWETLGGSRLLAAARPDPADGLGGE